MILRSRYGVAMPANFVNIDRDTPFLLPPDLKQWVAQDDPVHFVIEAVMGLEIGSFKVNHRGSGSKQYPPKAMLTLLIYCYSRGVLSSRKIEQATYRDVAVRYLMADHHPDHNTIASFRKDNAQAIQEAFVQVLLLANKLGMLKLGTVSVDGTRIKANASLNRNVRYDRALELIAKLDAEIQDLLARAQSMDDHDPGPDGGDALPAQLAKRQALRDKLDQAKTQLEQEAQQRARAKGDTDWQDAKPEEKTQKNLTDQDSRVMTKRKTTEQAYNAQAAVDADGSMLIVSARLTQSTDMGQLKAMVEAIDERVGQATGALADSGYAKASDIAALTARGLDLYVAVEQGRRREYDFRPESTKEKTPRSVKDPTLVAMKQKLETDAGKSRYRQRQEVSEPVFGIVKEQLGFRRMSLRGLAGAENEWTLVALSYNLKRMAKLNAAA